MKPYGVKYFGRGCRCCPGEDGRTPKRRARREGQEECEETAPILEGCDTCEVCLGVVDEEVSEDEDEAGTSGEL